MNYIKCPFCNRNLHKGEDGIYSHLDYMTECKGRLFDGSKDLWQELIRTRKALDVAIESLNVIAQHEQRLCIDDPWEIVKDMAETAKKTLETNDTKAV